MVPILALRMWQLATPMQMQINPMLMENKANNQTIIGSTFSNVVHFRLFLVKFGIASLQVFIFKMEHALSGHLVQMCNVKAVVS